MASPHCQYCGTTLDAFGDCPYSCKPVASVTPVIPVDRILKAAYSRAQAPRPTPVEVALVAAKLMEDWDEADYMEALEMHRAGCREARALIAEAEAQLSQEESDDEA